MDSKEELHIDPTPVLTHTPQLPDDVQGYIVGFLGDYTDLSAVSRTSHGFRRKAKPILVAMLKRSDDDINYASKKYHESPETALEEFGDIRIWDTSEVTNMVELFYGGTMVLHSLWSSTMSSSNLSVYKMSNDEMKHWIDRSKQS